LEAIFANTPSSSKTSRAGVAQPAVARWPVSRSASNPCAWASAPPRAFRISRHEVNGALEKRPEPNPGVPAQLRIAPSWMSAFDATAGLSAAIIWSATPAMMSRASCKCPSRRRVSGHQRAGAERHLSLRNAAHGSGNGRLQVRSGLLAGSPMRTRVDRDILVND